MAAQAQVKSATHQLKANAAVAAIPDSKVEFLKTVHAFEQEQDKEKSNDLLQQLKESMVDGLRSSKAQLAQAGEISDREAADKAMKLNKERSEIYNQLIRESRNTNAGKEAMVTILKKYAETL